ncbi:MAG: methyltransferase domain-containing protein [Steroidobacteraceae bacterium]
MKLHLGCWRRQIPGFIHVDLCDMPHIDHQSGIDRLPFLKDGSASLVYCSHAFEYFDRLQAVEVLAEWRRVLAPGGLLRLAVPDFDALAGIYRDTGDISTVLGPLYGRMTIPTRDGDSILFHRTAYDFPSLAGMLEANGFQDAHRWDWRTTEHAHIDDFSQAYFPHMQKDTGRQVSLNVEATKA